MTLCCHYVFSSAIEMTLFAPHYKTLTFDSLFNVCTFWLLSSCSSLTSDLQLALLDPAVQLFHTAADCRG